MSMLKYKKYSRKQIDLNTNFIVIFQIENNIMWTQFSTESLKNKYLIFHWNIETRKWEENWKRRGKSFYVTEKSPRYSPLASFKVRPSSGRQEQRASAW